MPADQPSLSLPLKILSTAARFLTSYALATSLLVLLLLITFLGTLEQVEHGLYLSQAKYFDSLIITSIDIGACMRALGFQSGNFELPLPLPGGYLVMWVFALNLTLGLLLRIILKGVTLDMPFDRKMEIALANIGRKFGMIISHMAMILMLVAGAVSFSFKKEGNMALMEGQSSDEFQSFHDRVVEIEQLDPPPADGKRSVLSIPGDEFYDLEPDAKGGKARTFTSKSLPFKLTLRNYVPNCEPKPATESAGREAIDGWYLQPKPKNPTAEQNIDGIYASIEGADGSKQDGLMWGIASAVNITPQPWVVKVDGKTYAIDLGRQRWQLPFMVRLDKFERELHPGTNRPRKFTSHVTKLASATSTDGDKKIITMNEPLRDSGYVLFQASFSMDPNSSLKQSVFAVAQNPSDHWPLYSCIIVAIGLMIHFIAMLVRFIERANKSKQPSPALP